LIIRCFAPDSIALIISAADDIGDDDDDNVGDGDEDDDGVV
jgi:hypothetical protein